MGFSIGLEELLLYSKRKLTTFLWPALPLLAVVGAAVA